MQKPNPWLLVLLTAPIPFTLFGVLSVKWYQKQTDFRKRTQQFVGRQNAVIAADAQTVAERVALLLMQAGRAARSLPRIRPNSWEAYRLVQTSPTLHWNAGNRRIDTITLPLFSAFSEWDVHGVERRRGGTQRVLRNLYSCDVRNTCDAKLIRDLSKSRHDTLMIGDLIRWYSPEGMEDSNAGAAILVGYRYNDRIFVAALDYEHLRSLLFSKIFPYERQGDPLEGYQNGNYVYIVDKQTNIIVHPKYWHVLGYDRSSGLVVAPFETDDQDGSRPLNIARYKNGKLRAYFDHLLKHSFSSNVVDIFTAVNLKGVRRIIATAPILFKEGQFEQNGIFGYVVTGCNVDYFEDPKEQTVPYY